jgi:imidazolonepropionase-like amidohydrolase
MICYPTKEEMAAVVEEAHNAGKPVAAHCIGGIGLDYCIELGVDTIEHGYYITPKQIDRLARAGGWLDMTVTPILSDYYLERSSPGSRAGLLAAREPLTKSMRAVVAEGVNIALGSDGLHGAFAGDVEYLSGFGATPHQALKAATIQGAKMIGLGDATGSLAPGKLADIIGLDANPLLDVSALRLVNLVVQGGTVRLDCGGHGGRQSESIREKG